jgi:hypothetical protein
VSVEIVLRPGEDPRAASRALAAEIRAITRQAVGEVREAVRAAHTFTGRIKRARHVRRTPRPSRRAVRRSAIQRSASTSSRGSPRPRLADRLGSAA